MVFQMIADILEALAKKGDKHESRNDLLTRAKRARSKGVALEKEKKAKLDKATQIVMSAIQEASHSSAETSRWKNKEYFYAKWKT